MDESGVVKAPDRVDDYFSARAPDYQPRSTRFPWSWMRASELKAVRSLLGDVAGLDVLELGAGAGFYTHEIVRWGARHVWAVDLSEVMLARLPSGPITPVLGDAAAIRIGRHFPVIVCAGMIEFVAEPAQVLGNAADHAEANARFIILAPRKCPFGRLYRGFHRGHGLQIQLFDQNWFEASAVRSGWQVAAMIPVQPFSLAVRLIRR
jgi:SAM-dependent methyltransferase